MNRLRITLILVAISLSATSSVYGQGAQFSFIWADGAGGSTNWFPMTYDSTDALSPILEDETVVRIYKDVNFDGGYTPLVDQPLVVGSNGAAGEIFPSNEFVFNSADIGRSQGSFLSPSFQYVGATPAFAPIFLLVGCDDGQGGFTVMYSSRSYLIAPGYSEKIINCPTSGDFIPGPCWLFWDTCDPPVPCDPSPADSVLDFDASEDDCDQINLTWTAYDTTGQNLPCDSASLVIRRGITIIATLPLGATSHVADPPDVDIPYLYSIRVVCVCAGGSTGESNPASDSGTMPRAPGVSTVTDASSGLCDSVVVTFDNPPSIAGLDSIVLKRDGVEVARDGAGFGGQQGRTIVHHGAPGGSATYTVCGWNSGCGYGDPSNGKSGEAIPVPGQVQNVTATTINCGGVIVTWTDLPEANNYSIFRDDQQGGVIEVEEAWPNSPFTDIPPLLETPYLYSVVAHGQCGDGPESVTATGIYLSAPAVPLNVSASDDDCDVVTVTWTDNSTNESGFQIRRWTVGQVGDTAVVGGTAADGEVLVDNTAVIGIQYGYEVAGGNACGVGLAGVDNGLRQDAPSQVIGVTSPLLACDSVLVSWNDEISEYGYLVKRNGMLLDFVDQDVTTYVDYPPQGTHNYQIQAFNNCGAGPDSDPSTSTMYEVPTLDSLWIGDVNCDIISLSWSTGANAEWLEIFRDDIRIDSIPAPQTSYVDSLPEFGVHEYFIVPANNCYLGEGSDTLYAARMVFPAPPESINTDDNGCDEITISWNSASGDFEHYIVYRDSIPQDTFTNTTTAYIDSNVIANMAYAYAISALNLICGESDLSETVIKYINLTQPPLAPEIVVSADGNDAILYWSRISENTVGCQIQSPGYIVSSAPTPDGPFWYLTFTYDTTFVHSNAVFFAESFFYIVDTYVGDLGSSLILIEPDASARLTREQVLESLKR